MESVIEESAINKINNLLSVANHQTANEHEAKEAMSHVMRILAKYNLDLTEFDKIANKEEDINQEQLQNDKRNIPVWKTDLLYALSKAHFCSIYIASGYRSKSHMLVGKPTNTQAVKILYSFLCSVIENESAAAFSAYQGWEHGKSYCNSFKVGMVSRIRTRLAEEKAKIIEETKSLPMRSGDMIESQDGSIVVKDIFKEAQDEIQKYYKTVGLKLRHTQYSGVNNSGAGYRAGFSAGANIPLHASHSLNSRN